MKTREKPTLRERSEEWGASVFGMRLELNSCECLDAELRGVGCSPSRSARAVELGFGRVFAIDGERRPV